MTANKIFIKEGASWTSLKPYNARGGRSSNRRFSLPEHTGEPPKDSVPCICIARDGDMLCTGGAEALTKVGPAPDESFPQSCITGNPSHDWATAEITSSDDARSVAQAIREGMAIAVSDGSFKSGLATAACCLEGPEHGGHRVKATCRTPGHEEDQDTYRAELSGIYMIVCTVKKI